LKQNNASILQQESYRKLTTTGQLITPNLMQSSDASNALHVEQLPPLYGVEKNGKIKTWNANIYLKGKDPDTDPAFATIEHGQQDGKKQLTVRDYTEGKNIGKKNETTPLQQCIAETKRKWLDKKEKELYQETMPAAATATSTQHHEEEATPHIAPSGGKKYFPMLAHKFEPESSTSKKHTITFPCYVQPKLDGLRCIIYRDTMTGEIRRQSRTGTYFDTMTHIAQSLTPFFQKYPSVVLDGELYTPDIPFEELAGLIKKKKFTEQDFVRLSAIKYHIYDIVDEKSMYQKRYSDIKKMFAQLAASSASSPHELPPYICLVETIEAKTDAEFRAEFSRFIEEGYEGIMLRNKGGMYRCNYRSHDLQKYKEFEEDEFRIIGFTQGDGRDKGTVIWICETEEGKDFTVRPRGTMESRRKLFQTGEKYVGKMLTVIYQELTEEGKPRFPVAKDVRDNY
jgi:ATP-dependent DNA ligase